MMAKISCIVYLTSSHHKTIRFYILLISKRSSHTHGCPSRPKRGYVMLFVSLAIIQSLVNNT